MTEQEQNMVNRLKMLVARIILDLDDEAILAIIEKAKEIPQGEWIIDGHHIRCNKCNEYICDTDREGNKIPDSFCPNCGAKMGRSEEE